MYCACVLWAFTCAVPNATKQSKAVLRFYSRVVPSRFVPPALSTALTYLSVSSTCVVRFFSRYSNWTFCQTTMLTSLFAEPLLYEPSLATFAPCLLLPHAVSSSTRSAAFLALPLLLMSLATLGSCLLPHAVSSSTRCAVCLAMLLWLVSQFVTNVLLSLIDCSVHGACQLHCAQYCNPTLHGSCRCIELDAGAR